MGQYWLQVSHLPPVLCLINTSHTHAASAPRGAPPGRQAHPQEARGPPRHRSDSGSRRRGPGDPCVHDRVLPSVDSRPLAPRLCSDRAADPIIFRPLKSFTFADSQQESLLRLTQEGISVYSPHTAVDATIGGVNDWLVDGISGGKQNEQSRIVLVPVEGPVGINHPPPPPSQQTWR